MCVRVYVRECVCVRRLHAAEWHWSALARIFAKKSVCSFQKQFWWRKFFLLHSHSARRSRRVLQRTKIDTFASAKRRLARTCRRLFVSVQSITVRCAHGFVACHGAPFDYLCFVYACRPIFVVVVFVCGAVGFVRMHCALKRNIYVCTKTKTLLLHLICIHTNYIDYWTGSAD